MDRPEQFLVAIGLLRFTGFALERESVLPGIMCLHEPRRLHSTPYLRRGEKGALNVAVDCIETKLPRPYLDIHHWVSCGALSVLSALGSDTADVG